MPITSKQVHDSFSLYPNSAFASLTASFKLVTEFHNFDAMRVVVLRSNRNNVIANCTVDTRAAIITNFSAGFPSGAILAKLINAVNH